jgi:hypothetical protein
MVTWNNKAETLVLDSNEYLSKSLRHYVAESFLAVHDIQVRLAKNPLFGVISLLIPTGLPKNKSFLASPMFIGSEPFQRTDISMKPLRPIFCILLYNGSYSQTTLSHEGFVDKL